MPSFDYTAFARNGKKVAGIIEADSTASARQKLKAKSLYPTALKPVDTERQEGSRRSILFSFRVSRSELTLMTRQLATLLSAGFPLVTAVSTLVNQASSRAFQKVLSRIKASIEEGKSFAEALSAFPSVFSPIYINMIRAGESSGTLEIVLERLADISERREASRKQIQAALAYPALMTLVGCGVLFFLLTHIVPNIVAIFSDFNQELPAPTQLLIGFSAIMQRFWWLMAAALFLAWAAVVLLAKTDSGAFIIDRFLLGLPYVGELLRKLSVARFTRVLGSLTENGIPLLTALSISRATAGNQVIARSIDRAITSVEQGGELGAALDQNRSFPSLGIQMISIGEKSGKLETMLAKTADLYDRDVQSSVTAVTAVIEPVIILVMGVVVGFIVLSICLPLVDINRLVQ